MFEFQEDNVWHTSNGLIYFLGIALLLIFGTIIVLGVSKTNDLQLDMNVNNKSVMILNGFKDLNSSGTIMIDRQLDIYLFEKIGNIIIIYNCRYHYEHNRKLNYHLRMSMYASEIY